MKHWPTQLITGCDLEAGEPFVPGVRARIVAGLLKKFPPRRLRPMLTAMKLRGLPAIATRDP
ncbi:MAG: hypothetical protein ABUL58_01600 [Steroidobacter sp.]